jgi:Fusaric acid resistance protein-like
LAANILSSDWSKSHPGYALRCVPALALTLIAGIVLGYPRSSVAMTAGAFSVGLGSFRRIGDSRILPMALNALGLCLASWIGALAGLSFIATVAASAAAGFAYGWISEGNQVIWWIARQALIWLEISSGYPARGIEALDRGGLALAGGVLQITAMVLWWRLSGRVNPEESSPPQSGGESRLHFALRAAVTLAVAAAVYKGLSKQNGYWIPMTAVIVLRRDLAQAYQRGLARIAGTMAGALIASLLLMALPENQWLRAAGVALFAWGAYTLFWANYGYYAICLTAYIVFLLSVAGLNERELIEHRAAFTALGGGLSIAVHWLAVRIPLVRASPPAQELRR